MHSFREHLDLVLVHPSMRRHTSLRSAAKTHACLVKLGDASDTCSWNKILATYSKCSGLLDACKLFDEIPQQDAVSWNSLVAAHVSSGSHQQAWNVLRGMLSAGLSVDQYTFGSILKSVASVAKINLGRQLHSLIVKSSFDRNVFSGSALIDMYAKCGSIRDAVTAFELMLEPNIVSWNALIAGYALVGDAKAAFQVASRMEREGLMLDEASFASLLSLLEGTCNHRLTSQVHAKIIKYARAADTIVYNAAISAYSLCGSIADSRKIFDKMDRVKDLVTWNSLLAAYAYHGFTDAAIELFVGMQKLGVRQDLYTFTSAISACFEQGQHGNGRALHSLVIKNGLHGALPVSNALVAMYSKPGDDDTMEDAWKCFRFMEYKDSVSWNSLLTGLSQNGLSEDAVKLFAEMQQSAPVKIDHYAFSATLRSCADLAILQLGRQIHGLALRQGFDGNEFVGSSLIYMYSKCGVLDEARQAFNEAFKDGSVTWNSMIFGYAQHGQEQFAFDLFSQMQNFGVAPDHITFVGLITACSHVGLVEEGAKLLKWMQPVFGVPLRMEHYACGVDLYGRAARLDEAKRLIESMPFEPDATVWMTLLGACRIHGDMELASHAAEHLLLLEPKHHSTYVLLSHLYSEFGMWEGRAMIQKTMRNRGLSKVPGWSWIEVGNHVHSFNADDRSHSQIEEIYEMLEMLVEEIESEPLLNSEDM